MSCYISKTFIGDRFVLGLPLEAVMLTVTQKTVVSGAKPKKHKARNGNGNIKH